MKEQTADMSNLSMTKCIREHRPHTKVTDYSIFLYSFSICTYDFKNKQFIVISAVQIQRGIKHNGCLLFDQFSH